MNKVFFGFYRKLSGMTGTARAAAAEFFEAYRLRVAAIPTNRPPLRQDLPLRVYFNPAVSAGGCVGRVLCFARGAFVCLWLRLCASSCIFVSTVHPKLFRSAHETQTPKRTQSAPTAGQAHRGRARRHALLGRAPPAAHRHRLGQ